jgi:hypothetical protein
MMLEALADRLGARRVSPARWLARCPTINHPNGDRHPSLSLSRGDRPGRNLVYCRSMHCPPPEIARAIGIPLAELLTEVPTPTTRRSVPMSPRTMAEHVAELAASQRWVAALPAYETSDAIRQAYAVTRDARRWATRAGPTETAWDVLALAADLEREALTIGAELVSA